MIDNVAPFVPQFSIVIPVHNRADKILPTLNSVRNQTLQDFECIIVDDGSTDAAVLKELIERLEDKRFKYIWQENGGGGAARNAGILAACGRYIAFLDSDDLFLPTKLEVYKKYLSVDPLRALYSFMYVDRGVDRLWIRPDRAIRPDEDMGEYLFVYNQFIQTSTIALARETAVATLFNPDLRKGQDLDFCLRLHQRGVRFDMVPEPLTVWVDQTESGRASRTKGYEAPLAWLEKSRKMLTPRAEAGYRATVLFYYMAKHKPFRALLDLWRGGLAGVPLRILARQFLRGFLPKGVYRLLVDQFVSISGRKP